MKLNADIVYENIKDQFPCEIIGTRSEALALRRPEFYVDGTGAFQKDHLYLLTGDSFPRHPGVEKGCVIVCSCNVPNLSNYKERCCIIHLKQKVDPFLLSNAITAVYNKYETWNRRLGEVLTSSADLQEMVSLTANLFGNPCLALDSDLHFVAMEGYDPGELENTLGIDQLSITSLNEFLSSSDMQTETRGTMHLNIHGRDLITINLFEMGQNAGSVTVEYRNRPYTKGDEAILEHFAGFLMLAMKQYPQFMTSTHSVVRKAFQTLVNEMPVDADSRRRIEEMPTSQWLCVCLHPNDRYSKIPAVYICEQFEILFPGSHAFSYQSNLVGFLPLGAKPEEDDLKTWLNQELSLFSRQSEVKFGISSVFSDLFSARLFYLQAMAALENGSILDPNETHYYFEDYALTELIINAQNDLPLEMYYSEGFQSLLEHDRTSSTSYLETLRSYLENNMSVTSTAADLHIHRSTLLERLSRIRKELPDNLEDPDVRLRLRIILKARQIQEDAGLLGTK